MSGGSFDYFYSRAPEELRGIQATLTRMADVCQERASGEPAKDYKTGKAIDLAALGEAGDFMRLLAFRIGGMARVLEGLERVTQGVEWWKSGDSGIEDVIEAWKRTTSPSTDKP